MLEITTSAARSSWSAVRSALVADVLRGSGYLRLQVRGESMLPALWPGDVVEIASCSPEDVRPGEIVLALRDGRFFLHRLVTRSQPSGFVLRNCASNKVPCAASGALNVSFTPLPQSSARDAALSISAPTKTIDPLIRQENLRNLPSPNLTTSAAELARAAPPWQIAFAPASSRESLFRRSETCRGFSFSLAALSKRAAPSRK